MTAKERVLCTLNGKEPDRVPIFDFLNSRPLFKEVLGRAVETRTSEDIIECSAKIGYDLAVVPLGLKKGFNRQGARYEDEWGTVYEKRDVNWPADAPVDFSIKTREDLKNFQWPDPEDESRLDGIKTAVSLGKEKDIFVIGSIRGPFSSTWLVTGFSEMMLNLHDNPDFVEEVMKGCTRYYTRGAVKMIDAGVDAILFTDDYGSSQATFISPPLFRERVLPHITRMVERISARKVPVIMHSDGHVAPFLEDLVETGISGYHPLERSAGMVLEKVKRDFGKALTLVGNVNNKTTLVSGSTEDVVEEVKECIRLAAPGGGYILASDHSLHGDIPNENIFALYEAGRKYGEYPISL
ncbi:MAG: hypothetical protein GH155_00480 [Spirochaeta sp.]|nr:hypothetical protein [Spirochaeta sp.]